MAGVGDDLGRHVLGGSAKRPGPVASLDDPREAEVRYPDVPVLRDHEVLRFEVPVDYERVVQVLQAQNNLTRDDTILSSSRKLKFLHSLKLIIKFVKFQIEAVCKVKVQK